MNPYVRTGLNQRTNDSDLTDRKGIHKRTKLSCPPVATIAGGSLSPRFYTRPKPDLQYDGLRAYAERTSHQIVGEYCDVAVSGRREGRPQLDALMTSARAYEFDCVLAWKNDRFARSTRHLLAALEEFDYLGVGFISVQDQIDTASPMGRAMFTIIGAMAELESSLISERVTAGMKAATAHGKRLGRPPLALRLIAEIEILAESTNLSIRKINKKIEKRASRGRVGEITKRIRSEQKIYCDRFLHVSCTYPTFIHPSTIYRCLDEK